MLRSLRKPLFNQALWSYRPYSIDAMKSPNITDYLVINDCKGVREIILNHEKTRNSLSMDMMDALDCAITEKLNDIDLRCIVLAANGRIWSAGHNLKELVDQPEIQDAAFKKLTKIILRIQNAPVPVIAKVNGLATAAGCQLAASCDLVICSKNAKFSTPGVNLGIFCSTPGVAISRVMPRTKSAYMLLTGLPITGEEAYLAGLATKVVDESQLDDAVQAIVTAILSKSRAVIAYGKDFFYKQQSMTLEKAYESGCDKMVNNLKMTDCKEGVKSFFEKRPPNWQHK